MYLSNSEICRNSMSHVSNIFVIYVFKGFYEPHKGLGLWGNLQN